MTDGPYRTPPPHLTHEQMRAYVQKRLLHMQMLALLLFLLLIGACLGLLWHTREQDDRLENQEFRTHVLWQAVEQARADSNVSRCRYIAGQRGNAAECAGLCLEELEDVSRLPSTKRYDDCLACLWDTVVAMPYEIRTGGSSEDLSLKALQKVLRERRQARER